MCGDSSNLISHRQCLCSFTAMLRQLYRYLRYGARNLFSLLSVRSVLEPKEPLAHSVLLDFAIDDAQQQGHVINTLCNPCSLSLQLHESVPPVLPHNTKHAVSTCASRSQSVATSYLLEFRDAIRLSGRIAQWNHCSLTSTCIMLQKQSMGLHSNRVNKFLKLHPTLVETVQTVSMHKSLAMAHFLFSLCHRPPSCFLI